jgi:hypothetical protein
MIHGPSISATTLNCFAALFTACGVLKRPVVIQMRTMVTNGHLAFTTAPDSDQTVKSWDDHFAVDCPKCLRVFGTHEMRLAMAEIYRGLPMDLS